VAVQYEGAMRANPDGEKISPSYTPLYTAFSSVAILVWNSDAGPGCWDRELRGWMWIVMGEVLRWWKRRKAIFLFYLNSYNPSPWIPRSLPPNHHHHITAV